MVIVGHLDIGIMLRLKAFLMSTLLYMHFCCAVLSWFMREIMIGQHPVKADGDHFFYMYLGKIID